MTLQNYKIWTNDGLIEKEDAGEMRHVDPQAAVEEAIKIYDLNNDFYFARLSLFTRSTIIFFAENEKGCITEWNLIIETVPQYYATEVK